MIESLFSSTTIPVMEQVAHFAQARHQVLAGNLANVDTPGYRTRDLSVNQFQSQLKAAIKEQQSPSLASAGEQRRDTDSLERVGQGLGNILHHDESNVSVEQQATEIMKNQLQHNLAMSVLGNQFRLLQAAIAERA